MFELGALPVVTRFKSVVMHIAAIAVAGILPTRRWNSAVSDWHLLLPDAFWTVRSVGRSTAADQRPGKRNTRPAPPPGPDSTRVLTHPYSRRNLAVDFVQDQRTRLLSLLTDPHWFQTRTRPDFSCIDPCVDQAADVFCFVLSGADTWQWLC
ncbi:hypothetical protein PIB30_016301 [Stylosanthes scabra]|uniref:Uncharacterized protein n=1 Tax=Stylosanthes scabra TaxID=79078 RepID=A0ABU6Q823_9FABA|nr:hypothetical protein [Stylosanthes scabra]